MRDAPREMSRLMEIGSAAAGIAHDINNQLFLIVNHLSVSDLPAARTAVERCSALTANLLLYCKGEAPEIAPLDPCAFLREFVPQLHLPPGIELISAIPERLPSIAANPLALARALTNLIS